MATELERRQRARGTTLKDEVNELLRAGMRLEDLAPKGKPFQTKPLPLGKARLESFDDIAEVLAIAEGEEYR